MQLGQPGYNTDCVKTQIKVFHSTCDPHKS